MKLFEDMQEEIRKLKAMIVKHEKRIRVLESAGPHQSSGEGDSKSAHKPESGEAPPPLPLSEPPPVITVNNNSSHPSDQASMAADEV